MSEGGMEKAKRDLKRLERKREHRLAQVKEAESRVKDIDEDIATLKKGWGL